MALEQFFKWEKPANDYSPLYANSYGVRGALGEGPTAAKPGSILGNAFAKAPYPGPYTTPVGVTAMTNGWSFNQAYRSCVINSTPAGIANLTATLAPAQTLVTGEVISIDVIGKVTTGSLILLHGAAIVATTTAGTWATLIARTGRARFSHTVLVGDINAGITLRFAAGAAANADITGIEISRSEWPAAYKKFRTDAAARLTAPS
jgi:hypothetical protein